MHYIFPLSLYLVWVYHQFLYTCAYVCVFQSVKAKVLALSWRFLWRHNWLHTATRVKMFSTSLFNVFFFGRALVFICNINVHCFQKVEMLIVCSTRICIFSHALLLTHCAYFVLFAWLVFVPSSLHVLTSTIK